MRVLQTCPLEHTALLTSARGTSTWHAGHVSFSAPSSIGRFFTESKSCCASVIKSGDRTSSDKVCTMTDKRCANGASDAVRKVQQIHYRIVCIRDSRVRNVEMINICLTSVL